METYYLEHVKKVENGVDEFFYKQLVFAFENGEEKKMNDLLDRVI